MTHQWRALSSRWTLAAIGCVVAALAAWMLFGGVPYQLAEQENVESILQTVDHFMQAGEQNDVQASARHIGFAPSPELAPNQLSALFQTRRDLFDGYTRVDQELYGVGFRTGWGGTYARVGGQVSYSDAPSRPFEAELVKRNNQWRLVTITFTP